MGSQRVCRVYLVSAGVCIGLELDLSWLERGFTFKMGFYWGSSESKSRLHLVS
jgi:hypothetical protein